MPAIFQTWIAKKINKAHSVRVIVICSDQRLLWRDSYKDVDNGLTSDESKLHKIIMMMMVGKSSGEMDFLLSFSYNSTHFLWSFIKPLKYIY